MDAKLSIHCPIMLMGGTDWVDESWGITIADVDAASTSVFVYDNNNNTTCQDSGFCGTVDAQFIFYSKSGSSVFQTFCPWAQTGASEYNVQRTLVPTTTGCTSTGDAGAGIHVQLPAKDASPAGTSRFDGAKIHAP